MPDRYLGRQIGKYRVIRLLGTGAFAWVYEAIDRDLEIPVALKILRPEFAGQDVAEARFRREAATAARLRHPNIVTVRDVGRTDDASFVAMDLLPLSLARRLELVPRLPEPEVVRIGLDVAGALAIAHAGGIIHRDIKPDNILIGPGGEAVVADFGLARALSSDGSLSATNQVMGTPHYFSPEQARGHELDGRSDLYALGVMLYRAATGKLPFEGDDWYAVARHHVETQPQPPRELVPELSPEFEAVLLRLLAKRPEDRYANAIGLADALATLPSAPVTRGSTLTPASSAQTVVNFDLTPSLQRANKLRWMKRARTTGVVAVVGAALWMAAERSGGPTIGWPRRANGLADTLSDAARLEAERTRGAGSTGGDIGAILGADSARRDTIPVQGATSPLPAAIRPDSQRPNVRRPPARATLTITAPESAAIYVDGERVGYGRWTGERAPALRMVARAVITDASQLDCASASKEVELRVRPGDDLVVPIPVRACSGVNFDIRPAEARVQMRPLDGGARVDTRADVRSVVVPTGRYWVTITAPRCATFNDSAFVVTRQRDGAPKLMYARLGC